MRKTTRNTLGGSSVTSPNASTMVVRMMVSAMTMVEAALTSGVTEKRTIE